MLKIDTSLYKKKHIDGWLVILDDGMYVKRETDTCIAIKNKNGKIVKINGTKEACDKCYQGLEDLPNHDRYISCCHWDYADVEGILFKTSEDLICHAWDNMDGDFTDVLDEIRDYGERKGNLIMIVYGDYSMEKFKIT